MLKAALDYFDRGWRPLPLRPRSKQPAAGKGWTNYEPSPEGLRRDMRAESNVGLILGNGLADVDLDTLAAIRVAPALLPKTGAVFGRLSAVRSHWLYGAFVAKTKRYKDPTDSTTLVELRGAGAQTMVPPSMHPCGEVIEWAEDGEAAMVDHQDLAQAVARVAAASLLARHWPGEGSRHDAALALAGFLLSYGVDEELVTRIIAVAVRATGDEEVEDRVEAVRTTAKKLREGRAVTGGSTAEEFFDPKVLAKVREWLGLGRERSTDAAEYSSERETLRDMLLRLADEREIEYTHDRDGRCYVTVPVEGHLETYSTSSRDLVLWLSHLAYQTTGKAPPSAIVREVAFQLEARARFTGHERTVHVRVAGANGCVYLDLGDDEWRVVEIRPDGWQVKSSSEVSILFRRTRGTLALPEPTHGGALDELRDVINVADDNDWILLAGWLLGALRPHGPYPVLALYGEQGAGKSQAARLLRGLVDPSKSPLRAEPKEVRDLLITARNSWCVVIDNVSRIQPWLSDALCRLATGGAFSTRALYTDDDEILLEAQRPVIFTAISEVAVRGDLLDRAIVITLPTIPDEKRRTEAELGEAYEAARPRILGALLDGVSMALHCERGVGLPHLPRMADHATWVAAGASAFGWKAGRHLEVYEHARESAIYTVVEASPVATAIQDFSVSRHDHRETDWTGTAAELLELLTARADESVTKLHVWPKTPRGLRAELDRAAPALRAIGITISHSRNVDRKRTRIVTLGMGAARPSTSPDRPKSCESNHSRADSSDGLDGSDRRSRGA